MTVLVMMMVNKIKLMARKNCITSVTVASEVKKNNPESSEIRNQFIPGEIFGENIAITAINLSENGKILFPGKIF